MALRSGTPFSPGAGPQLLDLPQRMRAKDRCQALLESLDAARLNTSSPGAYSAWMSWFCRQSHSKECGPNFPGEVMASGADFHTNSTTRCWDATRAVLSRALARCVQLAAV